MTKVMIRLFFKRNTLCMILSVLLNFIVEVLSRHSPVEAVAYLCTSPLSFFCNTLIILLTLTISLFFKRRLFFMATIASVWALLGIANAGAYCYSMGGIYNLRSMPAEVVVKGGRVISLRRRASDKDLIDDITEST